MPKVIDAIRSEHKSIARVLGILEREVVEFATLDPANPVDYALMTSALDYLIDFADRIHHPKEDLLFVRLRRANPDVARDVGDLIESHEELAKRVRAFADALRAVMTEDVYPRAQFLKLARDFIAHQRLHLTMEENHFLPAAERVLDRAAWDQVEGQMTAGLDPLIGGPSSERFDALRRSIVSWEAERHPAAGV